MSDNQIKELANAIEQSKEIVVFTGAGISTESGIADYRSKGGRWNQFRPVTIQEFMASGDKRIEYWKMKLDLFESMKDAKPNAGHKAIVAIDQMGKLKGLITQNIDGLHTKAGIPKNKLMEIHGTNLEIKCLSCQEITDWAPTYEKLKDGEKVPLCLKCGGFLKPNTISFGQNLIPEVLDQSFAWAKECDLMLALGSTLVVEPAASIPRTAKSNGAMLAIITLSETPLDSLADIKIEESTGEVLSGVLSIIKEKEC